VSRVLGSWIEVTVPSTRMAEPTVKAALDASVRVVGGATMTEARGSYVRQDTGEVERELVIIVRWDFDIGNGYSGMNSAVVAVVAACDGVVQALLECGEECVLARRYYADCHGRGATYRSELIFARPTHPA
jgi:hypothetical protein